MLTLDAVNKLASEMRAAEQRMRSAIYLRDRLAVLRQGDKPLAEALGERYLDDAVRAQLVSVINEAGPDLIRLAEIRLEVTIAEHQREAAAKRLQLGAVVDVSEPAS